MIVKCGIYGIRNKTNNKIYVGQSINICQRYKRHILELKKGCHKNTHLLNSFKNSPNDLELVILELCSEEELSMNEQKWIDLYPRSQLYNQLFDVQDWRGEKNPNYGNRASKETLIKMSEGRSPKLNKSKVLEIVKYLKEGHSHQEIADIFQIGRTVVTRISNGTRWTNVTGGPVISVIYDENGKRQFEDMHRKRLGDKRRGQKHTDEVKQIIREKSLNRKRGPHGNFV